MSEGTGVVTGGYGSGPAGGALGLDAPPSTEGYEAFKLEQRGIELIPDSDRKMRPSGLFWMWAGAIWNVEFLVYGALMLYFGLSFWQAVLAILVGNLAYAFLGWASIPGPQTGTTAFMVSRAPFGRNGNRAPSLFNWLTQVGFEVEGIVLIVLIIEAMFSREGTTLDTLAKVFVIIAAVAVQFIVPFLGHATIIKVLRYLSFVFIVVFAIMAILVVPHAHLSAIHQHASWWIWTTGLVLIVSAGGLGWTENAADYSRYLPRDTSKAKTFWSAALGAAIPSILLELLGAAAYLISPKAIAVTGLPSSFDSWFFWPFLILALPQLFAINSIDMYSSGVTLQAIGIPLKRWGCVVVDTVISGGITALVIFKGNFYTDLSGFLDYIVVWLGPWFGILMVDYLLRRGRYDLESLAAKKGGLYWRDGGFNWKALVSLALGMFAAMMWIDAAFYVPSYTGPLSNATHGGDFSWLFGMIVAGVVYALLSVSSVRQEAASSSSLPELPISNERL
ncbi:MAG: cytosine permease [Acidimicrobiales bacterium]|jgi:NCS1 nucleoside transporter family